MNKPMILAALIWLSMPLSVPVPAEPLPQRQISTDISSSPLFGHKDWRVVAPPLAVRVSDEVTPLVSAPAEPMIPPLPFVYIGRMSDGEQMVLFLMYRNQQYSVMVGDVIDADYRLEKIELKRALFTYLPANAQQTLPLNSTAVGSVNWAEVIPTQSDTH